MQFVTHFTICAIITCAIITCAIITCAIFTVVLILPDIVYTILTDSNSLISLLNIA